MTKPKINLPHLRSIGEKYKNDVMPVKDFTLLATEMLSNWDAMLDALEEAKDLIYLSGFYEHARGNDYWERHNQWLSQFKEEE